MECGAMNTCTQEKCGVGFGANSEGEFVKCDECAEGTFSDGTGPCESCQAGQHGVKETGKCVACAPGSYSDGTATSCAACAEGTFSDGTEPCSACENGQHGNTA